VRITLNGEPREVGERVSVAQLLESLGVRGERVAVEVNLEVVRRDRRAERQLAEGDQVEIVSFVGGG
jgi:sulfur carrier protein